MPASGLPFEKENDMNTESLDCRKVQYGTTPDKGGIEKPGDFCFAEDFSYIYVWLPGRLDGPSALQIQKGSPGGPRVWGWNGDAEKPSITPSIHAVGQWHGYLTNGRLVSC